jgi:hypothetical protein
VAGCCERGNEPAVSIQGGEFFKAEKVLASQERSLLHGRIDVVSLLFVCLFSWMVGWLVVGRLVG